ncbi:DUF2845 domain-containing protein [Halopseudomonas sp.]|uniref:DUF2845 domain-containing protein n=1 Tax=Halopseudomonas sp. TaxID=2901191 RepID=UPI003001C7A9
MNRLTYLLTPFLLLSAFSAYGATMRCDNGIVSTGDLSHEVLEKCGDPISSNKTNPSVDEYGHIVQGAALIEYWTYSNRGMTYELRFIDNRLVQISGSRQL